MDQSHKYRLFTTKWPFENDGANYEHCDCNECEAYGKHFMCYYKEHGYRKKKKQCDFKKATSKGNVAFLNPALLSVSDVTK